MNLLNIVFKELHFIEHTDPSFHHEPFKLDLGQAVHLRLFFFVDQSIPGKGLHGFTLDHILIIGVSLSFHCLLYDSKSPIIVQSFENLAHQFLVVL